MDSIMHTHTHTKQKYMTMADIDSTSYRQTHGARQLASIV